MERHDDIYKRDADGNVTAYQCASCSEWHPGFPTSWGFPGPDAILGVPQEAWEEQEASSPGGLVLGSFPF